MRLIFFFLLLHSTVAATSHKIPQGDVHDCLFYFHVVDFSLARDQYLSEANPLSCFLHEAYFLRDGKFDCIVDSLDKICSSDCSDWKMISARIWLVSTCKGNMECISSTIKDGCGANKECSVSTIEYFRNLTYKLEQDAKNCIFNSNCSEWKYLVVILLLIIIGLLHFYEKEKERNRKWEILYKEQLSQCREMKERTEQEDEEKNEDERMSGGGEDKDDCLVEGKASKGRASFERLSTTFIYNVSMLNESNARGLMRKDDYVGEPMNVSKELGQLIVLHMKNFMSDSEICNIYEADLSRFRKKDLTSGMEMMTMLKDREINVASFLSILLSCCTRRKNGNDVKNTTDAEEIERAPTQGQRELDLNTSSVHPRHDIPKTRMYSRHVENIENVLKAEYIEKHFDIDGQSYRTSFFYGNMDDADEAGIRYITLICVDGVDENKLLQFRRRRRDGL